MVIGATAAATAMLSGWGILASLGIYSLSGSTALVGLTLAWPERRRSRVVELRLKKAMA
jgi:hypothetical protein